MNGAHVLVMAKAPVPGQVKTRLCPPLHPVEAARVAEAALADTLDAVAASRATRRVLALDGAPGPWLPAGFEVVPQSAGTFGDRLAAAWRHIGGPGMQIGMDTPQVTAGMLDDALDRLDGAGSGEALLGLAEDGGWWALGLRQWHDGAFDGVPMSTPDTGRHQRDRLRELGLRVSLLPTLRDLDTVDDAEAIAAAAPHTRTARTVRAIRNGRGERAAPSHGPA